MPRHVVFDIEGTIVSHDRVTQAIASRLPSVANPQLLCYTWFEVAEREYTYASIIDSYVPFIKVFRAVFPRVLFQAGIKAAVSDDDLDYFMAEYARLDARQGAAEAIQMLRDSGFTVWAFTCSDRYQVKGYFDRAGIEMGLDHVLHCDGKGVAKPELVLYRELIEKLDGEVWFAAAHAWDCAAGRRAGMKAAYCSVFEGELLREVFGEMDAEGATLVEMAEKIIEKSKV